MFDSLTVSHKVSTYYNFHIKQYQYGPRFFAPPCVNSYLQQNNFYCE